MGLFTISMILPNLFNIITSLGINQALTRFIAQKRTHKNNQNINDLIRAGYIFNFISGSLISLALYFSADPLASIILQKPEVASYLRIASLFTLSQILYTIGQAVFTGNQKMAYRSIINISQSLSKGIISPMLVYFGYGISGVIIGHALSFMIAGFFSLLLIFKTKLYKFTSAHDSILKNLKILIGYGLPLCISQTLIGLANQTRGILLSWYISNELIGNYGIAIWFVSIVGVISASIGITLFPTFSKYDVTNDLSNIKDFYKWSVRYPSLLLIPLISMIIIASKPIILLLFGSQYPEAPLYTAILLTPSIFVGLGSLSNNNLLNSQGETRATLIINIIGALSSIILTYALIQIWNIEGLLIGIIFSEFIRNLVSLTIIKKIYDITLDIIHIGKIIISSILAGGLSIFQQQYLKTSYPIFDLLLTSVIFISSYLIIAPLMGAIEKYDIDVFDTMTQNIKTIYPLVNIIIRIEKIILNVKK